MEPGAWYLFGYSLGTGFWGLVSLRVLLRYRVRGSRVFRV